MINVTGLGKFYGPVEAVKDVSFAVGQGEIVGLLGHNGAGKTTVMKMITGFLEPSAGTVTVGGIDVLDDPLGVQAQIGYLPENAPMYPEMLVQEYLLMAARFRGLPAARQETAVAEAVRATGLHDKLLQSIATLSKGYRQRVGLAQAILHRPRVLILDEPTSGLDPFQIVEIRGLIRRLAESATVILSTHILHEVEAVCDRVIILIDGQIAADAPLNELLRSSGVRLLLKAGAAEVETRLMALTQVQSVTRVDPDPEQPGCEAFRIEADVDIRLAIGEVAQKAGWTIGSLSVDTPSLETVFNRLMEEHVARKSETSSEENDRSQPESSETEVKEAVA